MTTWHVNRRATSSRRWWHMSSFFILIKVSNVPSAPPLLFSHEKQGPRRHWRPTTYGRWWHMDECRWYMGERWWAICRQMTTTHRQTIHVVVFIQVSNLILLPLFFFNRRGSGHVAAGDIATNNQWTTTTTHRWITRTTQTNTDDYTDQ